MKSDKERLTECLECDFFETCFNTVPFPEEYKDDTCKTKDALKGRYGELESEVEE